MLPSRRDDPSTGVAGAEAVGAPGFGSPNEAPQGLATTRGNPRASADPGSAEPDDPGKGRHVENGGDTDPVFLEVFGTRAYQDASPSDRLIHAPAAPAAAPLNPSPEDVARFPSGNPKVVPL